MSAVFKKHGICCNLKWFSIMCKRHLRKIEAFISPKKVSTHFFVSKIQIPPTQIETQQSLGNKTFLPCNWVSFSHIQKKAQKLKSVSMRHGEKLRWFIVRSLGSFSRHYKFSTFFPSVILCVWIYLVYISVKILKLSCCVFTLCITYKWIRKSLFRRKVCSLSKFLWTWQPGANI